MNQIRADRGLEDELRITETSKKNEVGGTGQVYTGGDPVLPYS